MEPIKNFYSVYLSSSAVELRSLEDSDIGDARFICSQANYLRIFDFAMNLAKNKRLQFKNYVTPEKQF